MMPTGYPSQPKGYQMGAQIDQKGTKMSQGTFENHPLRNRTEKVRQRESGGKVLVPISVSNSSKIPFEIHSQINGGKS
jgi:hypothetical protein